MFHREGLLLFAKGPGLCYVSLVSESSGEDRDKGAEVSYMSPAHFCDCPQREILDTGAQGHLCICNTFQVMSYIGAGSDHVWDHTEETFQNFNHS